MIVNRATIGPGLLPELLTPLPQAEYDALPVLSAEDWHEARERVRADLRGAQRLVQGMRTASCAILRHGRSRDDIP